MNGNANKDSESTTAFDPLIQTEKIAFDRGEMLACHECGRMNPPNRLKCIYCARDLEVRIADVTEIAPSFRKLENWERGFNVIFSGLIAGAVPDVAKIARLLSWETDDLAAIFAANVPFPLARVETEKEAVVLIEALALHKLICSTVSDAALAADKPPVRLGRVDFRDRRLALKAFNTGKLTEIEANDLVLIVPGILSMSKLDSLEKKGRRGKTKLIDESATTSDETLLDIYICDDPIGFRVHMAGFDFSCLGDEKGLLAVENLARLIGRLRECSPAARLVDSYTAMRPALGLVWEIESRKDTKGLQRAGFGKREFGNVSSTSNLIQFTKYSRLLWQIYEEKVPSSEFRGPR